MAKSTARDFRYKPSRTRRKQLEESGTTERPTLKLHRAGNEQENKKVPGEGNLVRVFVMLAAVVGLVLVMSSLRF